MIDVASDLELMQDYIVGRLSEEERRAFEERLAHEPELVRELEQSLQLAAGLSALREQGYFALRISRARVLQSWVPTLAAAALAAVAVVLLWTRNSGSEPILLGSLEPVSASRSAPGVAAHFTFIAMRGSSNPILDLPAKGLIELRAMPPMHQAGVRFRVSLVRQGGGGAGKPLGELAGLVPGDDGYVRSYADAARLKPGRYLLRVETAAGKESEAFPFTLRAAAPGP